MKVSPFITSKTNTQAVMLDVIIALVPLAAVAIYAFGTRAITVLGYSLLSCVITDLLFGYLFLNKRKWLPDGAAVITALLLAFTLSPLTPWYLVVFGGISAILFGKILWGGLGKNRFNPALVGREFMTAFFPAIMSDGVLWNTKLFVESTNAGIRTLTDNPQLRELLTTFIYNPLGALGEYSLLALALGGIYLLLRSRISWHIPVVFIFSLMLMQNILPIEGSANFSLGGLLLGAIFMATDMPTSPTQAKAKIYFGAMLGVVVAVMLSSGINNVYLSYGILLMNAFSAQINSLFMPTAWGHKPDRGFIKWETIAKQTLIILLACFAIISLHKANLIHYLIYLFALYTILKFYYHHQFKTNELF